jgi:hypothetical protein
MDEKVVVVTGGGNSASTIDISYYNCAAFFSDALTVSPADAPP